MDSNAGGFRATAGRLIRTVTPLGWTIAVLAAVAWAVAARFSWTELATIAAVALTLIAIAIVLTIGRIDIEAAVSVSPPRVMVGERAVGQLAVTNRRRRSTRGLRMELPVGQSIAAFDVPVIRAGETIDELLVIPTLRRAVIACGPLKSTKGDPLGMLRRVQEWGDMSEIYVHPRTVMLNPIAAGQIRDLEGQTTEALSSSDIAFHTLRDYEHGDDLRHVHWRSSAKVGKLLVRQYNDTRRSHIAIVLSTDPDEYDSEVEFELGISCAASIALQAIRDGQTLTLIVDGREVPTVNPTRMLDYFSAIPPSPEDGRLERGLQAVRRIAREASVVIACTGSTMAIADVRQRLALAGIAVPAIVLRADLDSPRGYRRAGAVSFLSVPDLEVLRPLFARVAS